MHIVSLCKLSLSGSGELWLSVVKHFESWTHYLAIFCLAVAFAAFLSPSLSLQLTVNPPEIWLKI